MIKGKMHNFKVGRSIDDPNRFETDAIRKRPTFDRVNNFLNSMGRAFDDHDVYLWGSWPEKKTWDVDFLLRDFGNIDYGQMEEISKKALGRSLNNNNFLADVGFTRKNPTSFKQYANDYFKHNRKTPIRGFSFGEKWFANDKLFKDRSQFKDGAVIQKPNNIIQINSYMPYPKMLNSFENGKYNNWYANKPIKVKDRKKIYGAS